MALETGNARTFGIKALDFYTSANVLARTFRLDTDSEDFRTQNTAGSGGTIEVVSSHIKPNSVSKKHGPAQRAANEDFDYEGSIDVSTPIQLNTYHYYGYEFDYNEATFLKLAHERALIPQSGEKVAEGVGREVDAAVNAVIAAEAGAPVVLTGTVNEKASQILGRIIALRKELNSRKVSTTDRTLVLGSNLVAILLASDQFSDASKAGTTDALTNATLGNRYGFRLVEGIGQDENGMIAYTREAFALVTRPKAASLSAIESAVVTGEGYNLNVTIDRDGRKQKDLVLVGTFAAVGRLDPLKSVSAVFED